MASDTLISDPPNPLSGLNGPALFPRTFRAHAGVSVPSEFKDLDSIHNFMRSLESRSPEKVMNEAKAILDGGHELMESNLASFAERMGLSIGAIGKDRPEGRRQGLGLARKKAQFSLKTNISQPSVSLEPTLDIDQLQDPDDFFDAYERIETAKKEIQKQMGVSVDTLNQHKPSTKARPRRPGILGKTHKYKHRYSSAPSENDDMLMPSQETVEQDTQGDIKDDLQENIDPDPNPDIDLEEVELAASMKKTENEVSSMLDELLSFNNEDLDGDGALNLLQERLNIKPLDMENLHIPELHHVGRNNTSASGESLQRARKSSLIINSALKNLNRTPHMENEQVANPVDTVSSPTPPRSPFDSLSMLKKKIMLSNPLRDPFSPVNVDLSTSQNASPIRQMDKLHEQVDANPKGLGMSSEVEPRVDVDITEPTITDMDANPKDLGMSNEVESRVDSLPEHFVDENVSMQFADADSRPNEESDNNIEKTMNLNLNQSNPSVFEDEVMDDPTSTEQEVVLEKQPQTNTSVLEDEAVDDPSIRQQIDPENQPKVHQANPQRGKREAGENRTRKAHPMRKSLAEAGTSFETGVRRSKRIKMRPLEYWKGERFLYGRVDGSLKLLGLKYVSPGKSSDNLKVKPYISSNEYKELLEMAARH